jgi:hypothetical protein
MVSLALHNSNPTDFVISSNVIITDCQSASQRQHANSGTDTSWDTRANELGQSVFPTATTPLLVSGLRLLQVDQSTAQPNINMNTMFLNKDRSGIAWE